MENLFPILWIIIIAVIFGKSNQKGKQKKSTGKQKKSTAAPSAPVARSVKTGEHSHDRLSAVNVSRETGMEHWKHQLDDFLKAGIIDRAEYNVLLERYRQNVK